MFTSASAAKVKRARKLVNDAQAANSAEARSRLEEALVLVESVPGQQPGRAEMLAETLLALARLARGAGEHARCMALLEQTLDQGVLLDGADLDYLAEQYAAAGRADEDTFEHCLRYLSRRARSASPAGAPVLTYLEERCSQLLPAGSDAGAAADLEHLCRRILSAEPRLGFPHYYLGRARSASGDHGAALACFRDAGERGFRTEQWRFESCLSAGYERRSAGALEEAAYYFVEAAKANAGSARANFEAGSCLLDLCVRHVEQGLPVEEVDAARHESALTLLSRAAGLPDAPAEVWGALGRAYLLSRSVPEAVESLRRAVALVPKADTWVDYARALRRQGDLAAALQAAAEAIRLQPAHRGARRLSARVAMRLGDHAAALKEFTALAAAAAAGDADWLSATHGEAICRFELGDASGALACCAKLDAHGVPLEEFGILYARACLRAGEPERAVTLLEPLSGRPSTRAEALYYLACSKAREGDPDSALAAFDQAEVAGVAPERVALQRGMALEALDRLREACEQYEATLKRAESAPIRRRCAALYLRLGNADRALSVLLGSPGTPDDLILRAVAHDLRGDRASALAAFRSAAAAAPGRADIAAAFVEAALRWNDLDTAESALRGFEPSKDPGQSPLPGGGPDDPSHLARLASLGQAAGLARLESGEGPAGLALLSAIALRLTTKSEIRHAAAQAHLNAAAESIAAERWDEAADLAAAASGLSPDPRIGHLLTTLELLTPNSGLLGAARAETAARWERSFATETARRTETAHRLAVLHYWWAVRAAQSEIDLFLDHIRRSAAWWVYALQDEPYWTGWLEGRSVGTGGSSGARQSVESAMRKELQARIDRTPGLSPSAREEASLAVWAEFEVAGALRRCDLAHPYGPVLMRQLGPPEAPVRTAFGGSDGVALGEAALPFLRDAGQLLDLCAAGLETALACLASGRYLRAEQIGLAWLNSGSETDSLRVLVTDLCLFARLKEAEERYFGLEFPASAAAPADVVGYARAIRSLTETLEATKKSGGSAEMHRKRGDLVEIISRRTYNEFVTLSSRMEDKSEILGMAIDLLDGVHALAEEPEQSAEPRLHLASMLNRLALNTDPDDHDTLIRVLGRAVELAPENPDYRRNLAFSYYNRATLRKQQADTRTARQDIMRAFELAANDPDVRMEYELLVGRAGALQ